MTPTQQFTATLTQTPPLAASLLVNLNRLKSNLGQILTVLGYSKTVDDDLAKLDNALDTASNVLSVISVVPEVGQAASALKNAITVLSQQVKPARRAADRIEGLVKPLRDGLTRLQQGLDQVISGVERIKSTSETFLAKFTAVSNCINSLPDGTYKTQGQNYLNEFSAAVEPSVVSLNHALSTTNNAVETFYNQLAALQQALSPLQAISQAINRVLSVLNPVIDVMNRLKDALMSIKITIPVPYPIDVTLYDIFKNFGAFIDLAMRPIQDLVNQVLSALHVQLPSIPGLSDLINLHINVPSLPDFPNLFAALSRFFDQFNLAIPSFTLTCPPRSKDDQVPGGGKYPR